jgi:phosphate/sulfate permease
MAETVFLILVVMLLLLSTLDLFVGVSNDAANFLNSAVGTRIAPMGVIILVASIGVLIGASSSSGMMEIARKGMFYPEMFTFREMMIIFASVMISDVLLLNIFNSFGLPTSTTVSIIFELLGASVCASALKLHMDGQSFAGIFEYIKLDKTAAIVSGILLSVIIAFVAGMAIQFFCRILFTFRFARTVKWLGGIFTGVSIAAIGYFLIIKGAHGASFMKPEWLAWMDGHISELMWGMFGVAFVVGQVMALMGWNIFRLIVLSGTFALAFSFAGNDLVNFVGVPLAALDSFEIWIASGEGPSQLMMEALNLPNRADTGWLCAAGLVMCVTLFVSKKARHVVQTTVNLSSSSSGQHEQFGASMLGRIITRMGLGVSRAVYQLTPSAVVRAVAARYRRAPVRKGELPMPFDYVRASVNLVVASALISMATSMKLPLSTTYVTFMVAMGSSFADGAWDRESAVFRISGVITVIAGWFLTGMCAFTFSCVICAFNFLFGGWSVFALIPAVFAVIIYTNFIRKSKQDAAATLLKAQNDEGILQAVCRAVPHYFDDEVETVRRTFNSFFDDNEFQLRRARNKASNIQEAISENRGVYYSLALDSYGTSFSRQKKDSSTVDAKFFFYLVFSNMREAAKAVRYACDQAVNHVANRHTIFGGDMKASLEGLLERLDKIGADVHAVGLDPSAKNVEALAKRTRKFNRSIDRCQLALVSIIGRERVSMHSSEMYLTFLQELRELAARYSAVSMQERALSELVAGNCVMTPVEGEGGMTGGFAIDDDDDDEAGQNAAARAVQEPRQAAVARPEGTELVSGLDDAGVQKQGGAQQPVPDPQAPQEPDAQLTPVTLPKPPFMKKQPAKKA